MTREQYRITSFRGILNRFRIPRPVSLFNCWNAMAKSAKESKINCLFQSVNLILIILLMLVILPDFLDQWLSSFSFSKFELGFLPIGRFVIIFISYIIFKSVSWVLHFPLSDIFITTFNMTLWVMAILLILIVIIHHKLVSALLSRLKYDLILCRTNK